MEEDFGEIQPEELKFIFKSKKQISCVVNLTNKSDRYVAFKAKTTHPELYCVRPNQGIMKPDSTCIVQVTRKAFKNPPLPDEIAKEKFLFQRKFVDKGTALEDVSSIFRYNDGGKDINEKKLKVVVDVIPEVEVMKSKIKELDLRLAQAEETIKKLKKQKSDLDHKGEKTRPLIKCFNIKLA